MKKQKLAVCVLSAALMIGAATLTSYAAEGWQQSGNSWIYVDNNGNKVTNTWKKGADNLWRYLDSQGNIASNCWVDDEYFVESTGIMATDKWLKLPEAQSGMERDFRYDGLVLFLHQRKDGIRRLVQDRRQVLLLRR